MYIYYMYGSSYDMGKDGMTIDSNNFSEACNFGFYTYYYSHNNYNNYGWY